MLAFFKGRVWLRLALVIPSHNIYSASAVYGAFPTQQVHEAGEVRLVASPASLRLPLGCDPQDLSALETELSLLLVPKPARGRGLAALTPPSL